MLLSVGLNYSRPLVRFGEFGMTIEVEGITFITEVRKFRSVSFREGKTGCLACFRAYLELLRRVT
jgi:hypothetical protein